MIFFNLFKQQNVSFQSKNSPIFQKLNLLSDNKNFIFLQNATLYHFKKSFYLSSVLLDLKGAIYILEQRDWSFEYLNNATIEFSDKEYITSRALNFKTKTTAIRNKLNEINPTHTIQIYNFLILQNITEEEYDKLKVTHKKLLPKTKILFLDTSTQNIIEKFNTTYKRKTPHQKVLEQFATLMAQYLVVENDKKYFATQKQRDFLDSPITTHQTLCAKPYYAKTTLLFSKLITTKLQYPQQKIAFILLNKFNTQRIKQKLLQHIEYSQIDIDMDSIAILTPQELINKHLVQLKKQPLRDELFIEDKLMHSPFKEFDLILCDDADFIQEDFIHYLKHIQNATDLLIVSRKKHFHNQLLLNENFRDKNLDVVFHTTNPYAQTLHIIQDILKETHSKDILVLSSQENKNKLYNDLQFFIEDKAILLDSSKSFTQQELQGIKLTSYNELLDIRAKHLIMLDIVSIDENLLLYNAHLAQEYLYVLFENETQEITTLRKEFEN